MAFLLYMHEDLVTFAFSVFMGFFAVMNPIANTPVFIGLVQGSDAKSQKSIASKACIIAFIIVVCFLLMGKFIFMAFGITIPAFKITGGILLFYIGFEMLVSRPSKVHSQEKIDIDKGIAVSPLAIPILAGPGTIVTAMNYVTKGDVLHIGIVIGIFALMVVMTYAAFRVSNWIIDKIGQDIIQVIAKLMGFILSIMGVGMLIEGIKLGFEL